MPTPLPITLRASPLASNFKGTPQQFMDAMMARITLETQETLTLFRNGGVEPTSDEGPWLKNGNEWYVWSDDSGAYVPQTIAFKANLNPKPFRGNLTAPQDIVFAAPGSESVDLELTEEYDPASVFEGSIFTVPEDGFYHIDAKVGVACSAGSPTDNTIIFFLKKNGIQLAKETVFVELGDFLDGRTYNINTNLQLSAGDEIKACVGVSIGGGTGTWTISTNDSFLSGFKISNATF